MGSTWTVDLANVGAVYPWQGSELIMVIIAVLLAIIILPPYPFILQALGSDEFRWQFIAGAGCLLIIVGSLLYRRLPRAIVVSLLIVVSLAGAIPPAWQFLSIRGALDRVYGQPIHIGWGLWLTVAAFLIVAGVGAGMLVEQCVTSQRALQDLLTEAE